MGKRIIPPHDPDRLARVMDERTRMIGVDAHHLALQAAAKKSAEEAAARQRQAEAATQAQFDLELQRRRAAVEQAKKQVATRVSDRLRQQMAEKQQKDTQARELFSNKLTNEYFEQFGTSHR